MGLDLVELTIAIEDSFGIPIPNEVAPTLDTPGQVVEYLLVHLDPGTNPKCLEQRAFYVLRRALETVTDLKREDILPTSRWADLLPKDRWATWRGLKTQLAASHWPSLQPVYFGKATVGETARHLAIQEAHRFVRQDGWHRRDVEHVIRQLMLDETGVSEFEWTDSFVRDLHLD